MMPGGCLQDIHWYDSTVDYFAAAQRDLPDLDAVLARGDLGPLVAGCDRTCTRGAISWGSTTFCKPPPVSRSIPPISRRT
jgi:hypothetical protein